MNKKIILVEFISVDRFHRTTAFPFIKGWLQECGIEVFWVRFGLPAAIQLELGERRIGLREEDRRVLRALIKDKKPSHVLLSHEPAQSLLEEIPERACSLGFLSKPDSNGRRPAVRHDPRILPVGGSAASLRGWIGFKAPAGEESRGRREEWPGTCVPDFGWTAGNQEAKTAPPLPFVTGGAECSYARSIKANPHYQGIPFRKSVVSSGCAFCRRPRDVSSQAGRLAPLDEARRQLRAIKETHPPFPGRAAVRLSGEGLFFRVQEFAAMVNEIDFPPGDFLFDARADQLVRRGDSLEKALKIFQGTGHRIHICLVGIENFSAVELARMNKGISPAGNLEAIKLLLSLERDYPRTFDFREHGGLSLILFTPWTTVTDLRINVAVVQEFGLEKVCGKFFTGRLRLYPELPMTLLAQRDRLIVRHYDDPLLDTAERNFYPEEIPWRFSHPQVEAINRIWTRLPKDPLLASDPLYTKIQQWVGPGASLRQLVNAAGAVVDAAGQGEKALSIDELLSKAGEVLQGRERQAREAETGGDAQIFRRLKSVISPEVVAHEMGLKPVTKIEAVGPEGVAHALRHPESFPNMAVHKSERLRHPPRVDVFYGNDAVVVREAVRLTRLQEGESVTDDDGIRSIVSRVGILLGYPECCSRAFARDLRMTQGSNEWMLLARRLDDPGRLSPEICLASLGYVPCSLRCEKTLERMALVRGYARKKYGKSIQGRLGAGRAVGIPGLFYWTPMAANP